VDKFREKIPAFSGKKIVLLPIYLVVVVSANLTILRLFYLLPMIIPSTGLLAILLPWFPVIGVILMEAIGILLIYQMWSRKEKLKIKYGELSYQKIFLSGFGGVAVILSLSVYNFISHFMWQTQFWTEYPFQIFTISLTSFMANLQIIFHILGIIFSVFFVFLGLMMERRAIQIFGFDYMTVTYLYFPEESELQDHKIYSLLRHPAYSGAIVICLGGVLLQQNLYSILFFIIYYVGLYIHIHFVEEKELVQRFGDSYINYRNEVPAFFVKPKNYFRFMKLIFGKTD